MILTVQVKPNANETKLISWKDSATVIVAIKAPPKDGEANRELIKFLAKQLNIAKSLVEIKRGHTGRVKLIKLPDTIDLGGL